MNQAILIGRLTRDPEMRVLQSGIEMTRFTVAVDRALSKDKKQEAQQRGQPTVDFIPVVVWGKQAESCSEYLAKGKLVAVQGRYTTGSYEKDGKTVYTTEVTAERVQFLEWGEKMQSAETTQSNFEITDSPFPF